MFDVIRMECGYLSLPAEIPIVIPISWESLCRINQVDDIKGSFSYEPEHIMHYGQAVMWMK